MPADGPAATALANNGGIVVTKNLDEAIALSQRLAPEHLVCDSEAIAARLTRAGTVFVGDYSAQACGDYVTGSNHVLPTSGAAAARGGLSAADFVRVSTVQRITAAGLRRIGARRRGARQRGGADRACRVDGHPSHLAARPSSRRGAQAMTPRVRARSSRRPTRCGCT